MLIDHKRYPYPLYEIAEAFDIQYTMVMELKRKLGIPKGYIKTQEDYFKLCRLIRDVKKFGNDSVTLSVINEFLLHHDIEFYKK